MQNNILSMKKRIIVVLIGVLISSIILIAHTAYIQFIQGKELQQKAFGQQSSERTITAGRGTIYDRTGENILAQKCLTHYDTFIQRLQSIVGQGTLCFP